MNHVDVSAHRDLLDMTFGRVGRMRICPPGSKRFVRSSSHAKHGQNNEGPAHVNTHFANLPPNVRATKQEPTFPRVCCQLTTDRAKPPTQAAIRRGVLLRHDSIVSSVGGIDWCDESMNATTP